MNNFYHGVSVETSVSTPTPPTLIGVLSFIAAIITADDADTTFLPENELVELPDLSAATLAKCGTTGTAKSVVKTLGSQPYQPTVYAIRVPEGADIAETEANVLAGLDAIKIEVNSTGITLDLLVAPGLEENVAIIRGIASTAKDISAFGYAFMQSPEDVTAAIAEKVNYTKEHIEILWSEPAENNNETIHLAALAAVVRAQEDATEANGGLAKTISNVKIQGGVDKITPIGYLSADSDANLLNNAHITTIIQKKPDDFRFWGNRTASSNPDFRYETDIRISLYLDKRIKEEVADSIDAITSVKQLEVINQNVKVKVFKEAINSGIIEEGDVNFSLDTDGVVYLFDFDTFKPLESARFEGTINPSS